MDVDKNEADGNKLNLSKTPDEVLRSMLEDVANLLGSSDMHRETRIGLYRSLQRRLKALQQIEYGEQQNV